MNTGATESAITYIDGDEGILRYRGYDIEALADREDPSFLETAFLLIYGNLPTEDEREWLSHQIRQHTMLREDVKRFYDGFPKDAHPMATLSAVVSAMSTFYQDTEDPHDPAQVELTIIRLIAKLPTIAAYSYKTSIGQPFLYPDNSLDLIENFMRMMFAVPTAALRGQPDGRPRVEAAADPARGPRAELLDVDGAPGRLLGREPLRARSRRASTRSGARCTAARTRPRSRCSKRSATRAATSRSSWPRRRTPSDDFRLSGFGHRVYKNYDPRARILKMTAERVLNELGSKDELFDIAFELEQVALTDEFFIERKLYPNVDFYSGLIYRAMGFPTNMFPVLFAIGRLPGWIAHWKEGHENAKTKIGRPRQIYTGPTERKYVPIEQREDGIS